MSNSAINQGVLQAKINNVQNQADSSAVYSAGVWSFKNASAVTSVTIDNSGNVGIGTASPATKLTVSGTGTGAWITLNRTDSGTNIVDFTSSGTRVGYVGAIGNDLSIFQGTANNIFFSTSTIERMRIDASGNLLVGTTGFNTNIINRNTSLEEGALRLSNNGGIDSSPVVSMQKTGSSGDSTANKVVNFIRGPVAAGAIVFNGAGGVTFGSYSDERLKENFQPLEPQLDKLLQLEVMRFDFKEGSKNCIGTTAQKMQKIYPECVSEADNEEKLLSISDWSITEYKLVKAIQELSAKVEEQSSRLEAQAAEGAALRAEGVALRSEIEALKASAVLAPSEGA